MDTCRIYNTKIRAFHMPRGYYLACPINAGFSLGTEVEKELNVRYDMKKKLQKFYADYEFTGGDCLPVDDVFNLVIKDKYRHPTNEKIIRDALETMKTFVKELLITHIAIPRFEYGKNMSWETINGIIEDIFADTDITIFICEL